jgi:hypothetical protein
LELTQSIEASHGHHKCALKFKEEDGITVESLFLSGTHHIIMTGNKEAMLRLASQFSDCRKSLRNHIKEFYGDGLSLPILNNK